MDDEQSRIDALRRKQSEIGNHVIDEYFSGHISRRNFLRAGSVAGISIPVLSFLAACGPAPAPSTPSGSSSVKIKRGGHAAVGCLPPATALDPLKVDDEGGLLLLSQVGEFLSWSGSSLVLQPRVAQSWSSSSDAKTWTFKIRKGITFHDGTPLTAKDVAATINLHADPANGSNALSVFKGVLAAGAATAVDDVTLRVELEAASGNFPYLLSSDNYNLIILPANYGGDFSKTFNSCGPFRVTSYQTGQRMSVQRNATYWDKNFIPPLDTVDYDFYTDDQSRILALQGKTVQIVSHFAASDGQALFKDPNVKIIDSRSANHRQVHMRNDMEPFTDKRVRQAMALALNRPDLVQGLLNGKAQVANDSPFFKVYPSTNTSVAQREQNLTKAKQLLQAAGKGSGFTVQLSTWRGFEIPDYAQLIQSSAKKIGVTINLNIVDEATYYGNAVFGQSIWLDSLMGITDYGHRAVPNVFLGAPLVSDGPWNAAHFKNSTYDGLVAQYVATADLSTQRRIAGQIETLLLDETPIIFAYNYDATGATLPNIGNVRMTGDFQLDLRSAGFTS
ncbi:MAG TPA: ABC transporter substrate-binding protein [Candidatus Dormibacteraeota bacterium]|jgi:peptide/nickel transport system substrate-binding protein|nr:ABC transporter substrate-binding protein [Candidatus Dormibacteraeota bacterium]